MSCYFHAYALLFCSLFFPRSNSSVATYIRFFTVLLILAIVCLLDATRNHSI